MMKKVLFALSAVILLAAGCKNGKTPDGTAAESDEKVFTGSGSLAYVRMDSLVNNYDMYIELQTAYEEKAQKADNDLTSKGRSLERAMQDYQEKVQNGLVTRSQAQQLEQDLSRRQQNFVQDRERIMSELGEEEQVLLNQIQFSITEFLKEFNKDYRYDVILSTSGPSTVLSGNPKLDITMQVLEGLNKQYAATKSKPAATSATPE